MADNWLSTLGTWVASPLRAIFGPWWREQLRKHAETAEIQAKLFEAIVRFRLRDCRKLRLVDDDRVTAAIPKVIAWVKKTMPKEALACPESDQVVTAVELAITLAIVKRGTWAALACLAASASFDPREAIRTELREEAGGLAGQECMIAVIQEDLPFLHPFVVDGPGAARISPPCRKLLGMYLSEAPLPQVKYEIRAGGIAAMAQLENPLILPAGWKPS